MTSQTTSLAPYVAPGYPLFNGMPALATFGMTRMISANTSARIYCVGKVVFPAKSGSKNITKIHFRTATLTTGTSATVRVSVQGLDSSAGNPQKNDGNIAATGNAFATIAMSSMSST